MELTGSPEKVVNGTGGLPLPYLFHRASLTLSVVPGASSERQCRYAVTAALRRLRLGHTLYLCVSDSSGSLI